MSCPKSIAAVGTPHALAECMANMTHPAQLEASVVVSPDEIAAEVRDRRSDAIALFGALDVAQREQLVVDAWSIGLRALHNAHTAAQESKLKDIGESLVGDIDRQLSAYIERQQETITAVLGRFFDPTDGHVNQRLTAFLNDDGVLARVLDKYLGPANSVLAETLARQVGESSPLLKKLSTTDSEGVIKTLETQLRAVMEDGHGEVMKALDPLTDDGAVARFLKSLREELKAAREDRAAQLSTALAALDANDEGSLLSRLVRETNQARQDVLTAVNPETPNSPMAVLKSSLTTLIQEQSANQAEVAKEQQERQTQFEKEVREALTRIETKRTQNQTSTQGGRDFEDEVARFINAATLGGPCVLSVVGATTGVGRCKKGDAVLRFTAESAFADAGLVFEAKHEAGYTVQAALEELDEARKNRNAGAGVFVMARSHASEVFPRFARYGSNVLVTWDDQDSRTDPYLHAAILLGMALVTRSRTTGDAGDITALKDIEARIEGELSRLEKMEKYSNNIRKNVDDISDEVRKAQKALDLLLRKAHSTLLALKVELCDEEAERDSPIAVPNGSFDEAVLALSLK
jgi:hypothetical protein